MMKNLLIGNGVNLNTNSDIFSANNIRDRFYKALQNTGYKENEYNLKYCLQDWLNQVSIDKENIELIVNHAYTYVVNNIKNKESFVGSIDEYRVKKILTKVAVKAIFINDDNFIDLVINENIKNEIIKYDNVFTLNYYEYWDHTMKAKYLHGKIKRIDLANSIDSAECIFSIKENENKSDVYIVYPSDNLTPSDDLHPGEELILYTELKELDELSIFGVSTDADNLLLDSIKSIRQKTIFVHGMNRNEIREWKKHFGESTFLNSSEFTNERSKYE